jgi:hypothetical protein
MFVHPDGTVFARYGSRNAKGAMALNSMEGLKNTMTRVLEAHRGYPANKELFAGKRGPAPRYGRAKDFPSPTLRKALSQQGNQGCVHCHNIWDGHHEALVEEKLYDPRKVWKYPSPESIGLTVDPGTGTRVIAAAPDSAAARAGLRKGDVLERLNGQAIYSLADLQFVLHFLPEKSSLTISADRAGQTVSHTLSLEPGWRTADISWRGSMWPMPPKPGLWTENVLPSEKREQGIAPDRLAIEVRGVFGPAVRKAGLKEDDIIVRHGESEKQMTSGEFHSDLRLNYYRPGSVLKLEVLRDGERRKIEVKF